MKEENYCIEAQLHSTPYSSNKPQKNPRERSGKHQPFVLCAQHSNSHEDTRNVVFFTSSFLNHTRVHATEANIHARNKRFYPCGRGI